MTAPAKEETPAKWPPFVPPLYQPRFVANRCRDGFCGAEDCTRCHPENRKPVPYDDSEES